MKSFLRNNRGLIALLLCMGLVRTALADWNPIPSASMRPTLLEGDVVLVNRAAYDLKIPFTHVSLWRTGEPQRGDVITFFSPASGGGLATGTALALPKARVFAVEPEGHNDIQRSLEAGSIQRNAPGIRSICDGLLTEQMGEIPYAIARERFERDYLRQILARTDGNVTRAAAIAEVSRQMLQKLMRKYRNE